MGYTGLDMKVFGCGIFPRKMWRLLNATGNVARSSEEMKKFLSYELCMRNPMGMLSTIHTSGCPNSGGPVGKGLSPLTNRQDLLASFV